MNSVKNIALLIEFEEYISKKYLNFEKEVVFNTFMPTLRRFRADYLIRHNKLIIEINGGHWNSGRHNRGKGYEDDLVKSNIANYYGFTYLQFTYGQLGRLEYKNVL